MSSKGTVYTIANYLGEQRRVSYDFWSIHLIVCPLFKLHKMLRHNLEQNKSQIYLDPNHKRGYLVLCCYKLQKVEIPILGLYQ